MNCWPSGKYVNLLYMYSILGRGSFCFNYCLNSAWHGGDQFVALLRWYGSPGFFDNGLQVICIVGSGVSNLPLAQYHIDSLWGSGQGVCWQSSTVTPWSLNQLLVPLAVWAGAKSCWKMNQHLHKACQQKEAWSALKFPGRWLRWLDFRKHSGPTPADDMAAQIITDCGNFTLDFKQHGFCSSPLFLQTLGPWFPNEMQNVLSSEKRTLDHWATVQFFFSTAQVRCFWRCLWFRSGLVSLFLKTSERGDSWCTDSSFSPLLVKLSQVFESGLLDCILKLAVIPVACAPFPTQILPFGQLCI